MGNYIYRLLFSRKLEVVIVGLGNSGKTTLLHVLSDGVPIQHTVPTVGLNVRMIKKGGVTMKCWDLAGGEQYRNEWGRFTKGCDCILFVVDTNAIHLLPDAKKELHRLLEDRELTKTAVLVVANKIDLEPHATEPQLIRGINNYNKAFINCDDDDDDDCISDNDDDHGVILALILSL